MVLVMTPFLFTEDGNRIISDISLKPTGDTKFLLTLRALVYGGQGDRS